jgi:hypothetical protein
MEQALEYLKFFFIFLKVVFVCYLLVAAINALYKKNRKIWTTPRVILKVHVLLLVSVVFVDLNEEKDILSLYLLQLASCYSTFYTLAWLLRNL